jgi:hypothetical protein
MKNIFTLFVLFSMFNGLSQTLPISFEGDVTTSDFVDFDGGTADVVVNPSSIGLNTSNTVAKIVRSGGEIYAGSKIILNDNLDFSVLTKLSMKVYTTAPVGTVVKFKLEGSGPSVDVNATTSVSGSWETLEWIFVGTPNNLNEVVFMFDFGNIGDGSESSTFYFDDIEQVAGPAAPVPTTLPIDFESGIVNTDFLNYNGANADIVLNPQVNGDNGSATVGQVIRNGGQFWAGSKLFLSNPLDLNTTWQISMKVFTTAPVGTRIKLELENANNERTDLDYVTMQSGQWEVATWNFYGEANNYDKIQFLFDFGNVGDGSVDSTFYFDDVELSVGPVIPDPIPTSLPINFENSVVSSDFNNVSGAITTITSNPQVDAVNPSATVGKFVRSGGAPWAQSKLILTDFMDYSTLSSISMKVYTDAPVGTLLKFKVESTVAGFANERNVNTTVSGAWATYTWDFAGDPPVYNVLTLMLGYATPNDASENATFYFDDIEQVQSTLGIDDNYQFSIKDIKAYPNPAKTNLRISSSNSTIKNIVIYDLIGRQVRDIKTDSMNVDLNVSDLKAGLYIAKILTDKGNGSIKLVIEN